MRIARRAVLATAAVVLASAASAPLAAARPEPKDPARLSGVARSAALVAQTAVAGRDYRPGEVVVRYRDGRTVLRKVRTTVPAAMARISARKQVRTATPNWIARAAFIPNDPGELGVPGGWAATQWNFLPTVAGVNAPQAWDNLIAVGKPGGLGVVVAVLDTGVAYRSYRRFKRSPDFTTRLRRGYDFVDNDRYPVDHNGHGTHVASTIAEAADNGIALTGLAYGATIMPVRVLDRLGEGDSVSISKGIRYAAKRGAKVINLSFEFSPTVRAGQIPDILSALRYARKKGALVVGASGNASARAVAYPAKASQVLSVGAITEHGCQAEYSNAGTHLDLSAPGGGPDANLPGDPNCHPQQDSGRSIVQLTFDGSVRRFGLPDDYVGTSMAAPHVSAVAALVVASGVIGRNPTPGQIEARLKATADDLGAPGPDTLYGAGKVNAARATLPAGAPPIPTPGTTPAPTPTPVLTPAPTATTSPPVP